MKTLTRLLLSMLLITAATSAHAQKTIKGIVTTDSTTVLAGVTVSILNTTVSTLSDANGQYVISAGDDAVLVFSLKGFTSKDINVNNRTIIDVNLEKSNDGIQLATTPLLFTQKTIVQKP